MDIFVPVHSTYPEMILRGYYAKLDKAEAYWSSRNSHQRRDSDRQASWYLQAFRRYEFF